MPLKTEAAARKDKTTGRGAELQHRHFCFIADMLKNAGGFGETEGVQEEQWQRIVDQFADACAQSNPKFDRARFLKACGVVS